MIGGIICGALFVLAMILGYIVIDPFDCLSNASNTVDDDPKPKLTFDQFASFFALNPTRYDISEEDHVTVFDIPDDGSCEMVTEKHKLSNGEVYYTVKPHLKEPNWNADRLSYYLWSCDSHEIYFKTHRDIRKYRRFRKRVIEEMVRREKEDKRNQAYDALTKIVQKDIDHIKGLAEQERTQAVETICEQMKMMGVN